MLEIEYEGEVSVTYWTNTVHTKCTEVIPNNIVLLYSFLQHPKNIAACPCMNL